jgi:hypothetical protein
VIAESAPASTLRLKASRSSRGLWPGVVFGVGGDFDVEVIAGLGADELDQFVGVAELAGKADAGGQVAAQGDDAADAGGLVALQDLADVLAGRADARQVRRRLVAFALDLEDVSKVRSWVVPPRRR